MAKSPRKPRTPAPEGETKSQKFVRLGGARVGKALKAIRGIGNLAGRGYEYTPAQVDKIAGALKDAVNSTMGKFDPNAAKSTEAGFTF